MVLNQVVKVDDHSQDQDHYKQIKNPVMERSRDGYEQIKCFQIVKWICGEGRVPGE
jgi:hypothetical protein